MRKRYLDRIVNWVLHLTSYPGEWCKGYHHEYDLPIKDFFPEKNKFAVGLAVDNGDLSVEVWEMDNRGRNIIYVPEAELSTRQLRTIYRCLKSINLFKP